MMTASFLVVLKATSRQATAGDFNLTEKNNPGSGSRTVTWVAFLQLFRVRAEVLSPVLRPGSGPHDRRPSHDQGREYSDR